MIAIFVLGPFVFALLLVTRRHAQKIDELRAAIVQMNEEHYDQTGTFLL